MPAPTSSDSQVLRAVRRHTQAENPSSFLTLNSGNEVFTSPDTQGVIVYRRAGRFLVQFGGPFADEDSYEELLRRFVAYAHQRGLRVVGVQLQFKDAGAYARNGFTVNQIGASWAVDLSVFTLRGTRFMQLRNKISRARRNGLRVTEVDAADASRWQDGLREIDEAWLGTKGDDARALEFLVGQIGGPAQKHRRLFLGTIEDRPVGYISYAPVYGSRAGWMHDLSRRVPGGSPGLMEAINAHAIEVFTAEEVAWLHFGFTPFTGLDANLELDGHSPSFRWLMHFLWEHGEQLYPAKSQLAYKEKWAPQLRIPEYVAFDGDASPAAFAHIFRACNAF
ncbi:bifunctional lysylphosphatidylglycerol flippase/synthetase MprF [Streptomyces anulatus]|uniref:bifunctional lysylphosphatidylglycerol flippase/synthetase MprF n=1 Tax=Streptomyces anulatus TaxID=1892 RepID=UPI0036DA7ED6